MLLSLLVQRFSHLSLASAMRPEGLEFNQSRLNHTRFALTAQRIDDFLATLAFDPDMLHSPLLFRIQAIWQG
jgi:hypothetical protein